MKFCNPKLLKIVFIETQYAIRSRYLGSSLGRLWIILHPIIIATIYTFLMSYVFKMKLGPSSTDLDYAVYLLIGMAAFNAFSEAIMLSASSITTNASLIKNLVFPQEILPICSMLTGIVNLIVTLFLAIIIMCISGRTPGWALIILPFWIFLEYLFLSGICLFVSAYNVFNRDIQQVLNPILTVIMFASPVFYVESAVPDSFRYLWLFNPLYHILNGYRSILMTNEIPSIVSMLCLLPAGVIFLLLGCWAFMKTKPFFEERL